MSEQKPDGLDGPRKAIDEIDAELVRLLARRARYVADVARYKEQIVEPRRDSVRAVLRRGIETGEIQPGTDVEVAMLLLTGAVMARGKHDRTSAAPGFVERAVDELLRAWGEGLDKFF